MQNYKELKQYYKIRKSGVIKIVFASKNSYTIAWALTGSSWTDVKGIALPARETTSKAM